jgi:puromycin-sensitive aminopeptidase
VTYRESALLIDPEKSSAANKQRVAIVIAHELAHQWFGNLVTMEWWTHLWLNEGFASYMEYLSTDKIFPEWDLWTQFVYMDMGSALSLDSLANTHPIEVPVNHPDEISEIFDAVSYSKGATVIRMLAEYLGYQDFRDGLRSYLKKHQFGNAKTEDLWLSFEKVSGKPVRKIMSNWTGQPGYPLIRVEVGGGRLELIQSRFYSSPKSRNQSKDDVIWSIPVTLSAAKGIKNSFLVDKKNTTIPKPKGEWFKLNFGEAGMYRTQYKSSDLEALKEPVEVKELDAVDRLGLIRDAFDLAEAGELQTADALNLAQSYKDEDDYTVWAEISSDIHKLDNLIADEKFYPMFEKFGKELFSKIAQKLGWEKQLGEKHTDSLLRSITLYNFGSYGDKETIKKAQELFKNSSVIPAKAGIYKNKQSLRVDDLNVSPVGSEITKELDPDLRNVVYGLVAKNGGEKEFKQFLMMHQKEELQHEKDRITRALSLFKQKSLLKKTLEFALSKEVRSQDAIFIISTVWGNPEGEDLAFEYVMKNWRTFKERYSGGHFLLPRLLDCAGSFTTEKQLKEFKDFFKKNPTPEADRTIKQVIEKIESNIEWLKRDKKGVEKFLKELIS